MSKRVGTNTSSVEESVARRKRRAEARRREEQAWAERSGPVTARQMSPRPQAPPDEAEGRSPIDLNDPVRWRGGRDG